MAEHSIAEWIDGLKKGDPSAARRVWERYYEKLVRLARAKLRTAARRVADEEDVALSALDSFCRAAADGRFPHLEDGVDLWRLLFTITERKALRQIQFQNRQKRGGGRVGGESRFVGVDSDRGPGIEQVVVSSEPTPALAMQVAEGIQQLMDLLDDDTLRRIATAKMEGFTNLEIAEQLELSERSVKRKLKVIRTLWLEHRDDSAPRERE